MTPLGYLRMLARHWLALAIPLAVGVALAAGYLARTPPRYRATSQLFFTAPSPKNNLPQLIEGQAFVQSRMPTYAALVTSPLVTDAAIERGRLGIGRSQLRAGISVEQPPLSTLLNISVSASDPDRAVAAADALADQVAQVVTRLDASRTAGDSPVTVRQTRRTVTPRLPSWPRPGSVVAAGVLFGLIAGLLLAAARHTRDAAVRGRAGVLRATGLEPLAVIPRSPRGAAGDDAESARANAVEGLRTALQHGELAGGATVLAVVSARPGDGRTSVAVDLAYALALSGADVALVETDLRRPVIARTLRLGYGPGLANVLLGQFEPGEVMTAFRTRALSVLPAGWSAQDTSGLLTSPSMERVLARLREQYSHVIVDTPPTTSAEVLQMVAGADAALVVVRHDRTPGQSLADLMHRLHRVRVRIAGVVLTAAPTGAGENADPHPDATPARPAQTTATDG